MPWRVEVWVLTNQPGDVDASESEEEYRTAERGSARVWHDHWTGELWMLWSSAVLHEPSACTLLAAEPIGPKVRTWIEIIRVFYYCLPSWDTIPVDLH